MEFTVFPRFWDQSNVRWLMTLRGPLVQRRAYGDCNHPLLYFTKYFWEIWTLWRIMKKNVFFIFNRVNFLIWKNFDKFWHYFYTSGFQTFWLAAPLKRPKIFSSTPKYVQKLEMDAKILQTWSIWEICEKY